MVTEGAGQERRPDNIPATVNTINELLAEAHAAVSKMAPEPTEAEVDKAPEEEGLEAALLKARDSMQHLCTRLNGLVRRVGRL